MSDFYFLTSKRNGILLIHQEMIHNYADTKDAIKRYKCQSRKCQGAIYLKDDKIYKIIAYDHGPMTEKIKKRKIQLHINELSLKNYSVNEIVCNIFDNEELETNNMISVNYIKDTLKRKRNKINNYQPKNFNDIPEILKFDKNGDLFLRHDSGFECDNRFIIFYSKYKENSFFKNWKILIIDGTFKISSANFYQ
ncbi:hypothetical protein DMUE_1825 [Dictyocoela muelleri]|nr:hypothetical protein DMUE_1825 [Dictyocoela muelleri]